MVVRRILVACTLPFLWGLFTVPTQSLTPFEQVFVATSIAGQVLFLLFVHNACLLGLSLLCLVVVQGLWIVFGHCIVNDGVPGWFPTDHAYGKYVEAAALTLTVAVSAKFGWSLHVEVRQGML
jgi:hypothetical protein